eukprot:TRINITY_DN9809_c0_g1_i1.p1 TRINITY_DN9809_c0_g1~~TRINITY_DN9809_c0_g1_i1.p1  ORF type:complete len:435 (-),score=106.42 TRINITY_DN9809_c0_g1_i1:63-1289(-)
MAGRALRQGTFSEGLFTSWMEELSSMVTSVTGSSVKAPKKMTKRAQRSLQEAEHIIGEFCQVYPAARAEPTEEETQALWERLMYFKANFIAASISDQLSLRDGEIEWQRCLRALCLLEYCFREESPGSWKAAVQVCDDSEDMLRYLASDVNQCSAKAKQVLQKRAQPPPRTAAARPLRVQLEPCSPETPPMPEGELQYKDVAEIAPLCAISPVKEEDGEESEQKAGLVPHVLASRLEDHESLSMKHDGDSETTASSGEEDRMGSGSIEVPTTPHERCKVNAAKVPAAPSGDGELPDDMAEATAGIAVEPSVSELAGLTFKATPAASSVQAAQSELPKDLCAAFEVAGPAKTSKRPFLWLASVETAMTDKVTWQDPLAQLNPTQLEAAEDRRAACQDAAEQRTGRLLPL